MFATYLILTSASNSSKRLRGTGNKVLIWLMGLIVIVIVTAFFYSGLKPVIEEVVN
jgi:small neutral amino acid transporter SnatA (MarC family)